VGRRSTAYYSTGIPNIEVFTVMPKQNLKMLKLSRYIGWLLSRSRFTSTSESRSHPAVRETKNAKKARRCYGVRRSI
jgi:hypothetical protein